MKQSDSKKKKSLIYRLRNWWAKRQHLIKRRKGLIPEVIMKSDGRMILPRKLTEMFGVTDESSVIVYCSDNDCTDLAIAFSTRWDHKGFQVIGGKDGRPYFIRLDKYYSANNVTPPTEDTVCELISINQQVDGHDIYSVVEKASIE